MMPLYSCQCWKHKLSERCKWVLADLHCHPLSPGQSHCLLHEESSIMKSLLWIFLYLVLDLLKATRSFHLAGMAALAAKCAKWGTHNL